MTVYPTLIEIIEKAQQNHKCTAFKVPRVGQSGYEEASYGELLEWSQALVAALQTRGIRPGDKIALIAKPRLEWAIAFYGILRTGAVVVPIDASLQPEEVERLLLATDSKWVMASAAWISQLLNSKGLLDRVTTLEQLVSFDHDQLEGVLTFGELLSEAAKPDPVSRRPSDLALLMCTSGTTGDAKAVMLSHENLSSNVINSMEVIDINGNDVMLEIAPWNHIFGVFALLICVYTGAKLIYTNDYRKLPAIMAENGVTVLVGVPKLFHGIFEKLEQTLQANFLKRLMYQNLPKLVGKKVIERFGGKLRFLISGSAPLAPNVMKGFRRLGIGVIEGYGMTETAPTLAASTAFNEKHGSVGPPLPPIELKIAEPDDEGIGEVVVRGPNVMQGYYKNEARTAKTIDEDGWLHTGDLGYLDEENWLFLKGRKKNVIVLENGKNVYPEEVEFELCKIPEIAEVMVCAGERKGVEVIKVLVYPDYEVVAKNTSTADLKSSLWTAVRHKSQNLARFKRPKSEHDLIVVDTPFEKTSTLDIKRYLYQSETA